MVSTKIINFFSDYSILYDLNYNLDKNENIN